MHATKNERSEQSMLRERMQRRAIENVALSERSAGARVTAVVRDRIADGSERVVITNAGLEIPRELVDHAFEALRYSGLVCAPDADGAIALLGMTQPLDELLAGVPWDASDALEQLLSAARERHVSVMLLPPARHALLSE
jgi:glycosyltransferase A (GT-A) superfamily protein (DUF2064 family)